MKNYNITVNGVSYEVQVEEVQAGTSSTAANSAPVVRQAPKQASLKTTATDAGAVGAIRIESPMQGKILEIKAEVSKAVKLGEPIIILEAMKMENEIVATQDGVLASINVSVGDTVETGQLLATLN